MRSTSAGNFTYGRALVAVAALALTAAAALAGSGNYLIVAAEDYVGTAPLTQFIAAKEARGFDVSVYSVPAGTSRTAIKSYIQGLWGGPDAPDYLLLVGDTDGSSSTSNTIPHWSGAASGTATDLPYACMDAGDDWYPDIYIGRFSVRTESQLQDVVDKTLFVEAGVFPDPDYARRAALLATDDTSSGAEDAHNWVIANYLDPANYESTKIYATQGGGTADITAAVNAGSLFTVYFGHSGSSGWWNPGFNQGNVNALTNTGLYGLVFGFSCSTAHYEYDECYGETWQRAANKGAAAYISASTFIYWTQSPWHESQNLEKFFFESFFVDNVWEVGPAWQAALYRLLDHYGPTTTTRDHFEMFAVLGDPSLLLPQYHLGPDPVALVRSPNGGEVWKIGEEHDIEWTAYDDVAVTGIDIYLSTDGGATFPDALAVGIPNTGTFAWEVPAPQASACRIKVVAHDDDGRTGEDVSDADFTTTPFGPAVVHDFPFDTDPGWSCEGQWAFGQPTGGGGSHGGPDPTSGYTGDNVYGYNLSGDYESSMPERHLTTTALDCTGLAGTTLGFWRWLGVEEPSWDHAYIRVSNNGSNWTTVWQNVSQVADTFWVYQEFDISAVADDQETVYIRWTMGTSDSIWEFCGWNIDDVQIIAVSPVVQGDLNCDGAVNVFDIDPFVLALTDAAAYEEAYPDCNIYAGDCNDDGYVNSFDIDPFVTLLTGGE